MNKKRKKNAVVEGQFEKTEKKIVETGLTVRDSSFVSMINTAVQKGMDLNYIKELRDIRDQEQAKIAKEEFILSLNEFKQNCPAIVKDKTNKQFASRYSSIESIVANVVPTLSKYGLSHRWDYPTPKKEGLIAVTCILTHKLGHSETVTLEAPPDSETGISRETGKSSKNPIQQIKSTLTYLKIITFEAVTGLVAVEDNLNDDGNGASRGLDDATLGEWIQVINESDTKERLMKNFSDAYKIVKKLKDGNSFWKIQEARDNTFKTIEEKELKSKKEKT